MVLTAVLSLMTINLSLSNIFILSYTYKNCVNTILEALNHVVIVVKHSTPRPSAFSTVNYLINQISSNLDWYGCFLFVYNKNNNVLTLFKIIIIHCVIILKTLETCRAKPLRTTEKQKDWSWSRPKQCRVGAFLKTRFWDPRNKPTTTSRCTVLLYIHGFKSIYVN